MQSSQGRRATDNIAEFEALMLCHLRMERDMSQGDYARNIDENIKRSLEGKKAGLRFTRAPRGKTK
jgi:hypothetical protein